jgi:AraC-like DNA-binding protein
MLNARLAIRFTNRIAWRATRFSPSSRSLHLTAWNAGPRVGPAWRPKSFRRRDLTGSNPAFARRCICWPYTSAACVMRAKRSSRACQVRPYFRRKLVFVPAGHKYRDWGEPRIRTRVTYFYFDPAALAINADLSVTELPFSPRLFFEDNGLWDLALKLTTSMEGDGSVHRPYVEALGVLMAHELIRLHTGEPAAKHEVRGGLAAWQERTVVAYIEDHLAEPISLATLAQLARLSAYHFSRAFKQSFGRPPHRYHTSRRIERAKALLAKPAQSVTEIGFTMEFSEASSFTAAFRRETGLTPSSYRRSFVQRFRSLGRF